MAALFLLAKKQKQLKCPSTDDQMKYGISIQHTIWQLKETKYSWPLNNIGIKVANPSHSCKSEYNS